MIVTFKAMNLIDLEKLPEWRKGTSALYKLKI
jgi:hypothetical protein